VRCSAERRCRRRECDHCGPIRADDERRRFIENLLAYGGRVALVAVTAAGLELLPWEDERRVLPASAWEWNRTAPARWKRLWDAATRSADRLIRRQGYGGERMPRLVASVKSPQRRGVWHLHLALPAATGVEAAWSRQVVRFLDRAWRAEQARYSPRERRALLALEARLGAVPPKGVYGFGFVDRNPLRRGGGASWEDSRQAAYYLADNAASYLADNASESAWLPGWVQRSYVSRRLTTVTRCTMRNLRRVRFLHVCLSRGLPLPEWTEEEVEAVWRLLVGAPGAARAP
jgi:hypothetical protein